MRPLTRLVTLVVVLVAVAGCLSTHDVLTDQAWRLVQVHEARPIADGTISFGSAGAFTVDTGCNTVGGAYRLEGNRIILGTTTQTLMPCEGALAEQEAAVMAVVRNRPAYAIETGTGRLLLTSDAGQVLAFEAP